MAERFAAFPPRSAFKGLLTDAGPPNLAGVTVSEIADLGMATVLATDADVLRSAVRDGFGLDLAPGPTYASAPPVTFIGTGPGRWLALRRGSPDGWRDALAATLGSGASVVDQSDGLGVLRLGGPRIREVLAKGLMLDLHPVAFPPGAVAVTAIAHIGVTLWRLEDAGDGSALFEIAVPRSMAGSFWHWLSQSAAEFGLKAREHDSA